MPEDEFLSVQEVCDILGLANSSIENGRSAGTGRNTIYRYIKNGQIEATNLGGSAGYRIRRSELDRFIRAREAANRQKLLHDRVLKVLDGSTGKTR